MKRSNPSPMPREHCAPPYFYTDLIANEDDDTDVEEAIAREERYIALYQAGLERLSSEHKKRDSKNDPNEHAVERAEAFLTRLWEDSRSATVPWDSHMPSATEVSLPKKDDDSMHQRLQIAIRPFCFTKVELGNAASRNGSASSTLEYDYVLHGYFVIAPLVPVVIRVRLASCGSVFSDDDDDALRIVHVDCRLEHGADEVHRSVHQVVRELTAVSSAFNDYIPLWITCMNEYLEFDHARRTLLSNDVVTKSSCACPKQCTIRHHGHRSFFDIPIYQLRRPPSSCATASLNDDGAEDRPVIKPSHILSLVCSWRWSDRKASLRLSQDTSSWTKTTSPSSSILRQADLDQLVVACDNDCWRALSLLLTHCSGCTCWKKDLNPSLLSQRSVPDLPSTYLQDPLDDADDEGDDEEEEDFEDGYRIPKPDRKRRSSFDTHSNALEASVVAPTSPHRLSPSGRRRSDYEVQRLVRIERNEHKLSQLGLLRATPNAGASADKSQTRKQRAKRRRLSLPVLSGSKRMYHPIVQPRSNPKRSNDAISHRRPIARPKTIRGQPPMAEPNVETSERQSGIFETEDGFLRPKIPPSRTEDGYLFKRPRGAAPAGYHWDSLVGLWVPLQEDDHAKLLPPSVEEMPSESTQPRTFKGFVITDDNCLLPKKELENDTDGASFKRPRGAAPLGYDWNPIRGVWEPMDVAGRRPLLDAAPISLMDEDCDHGTSTKVPFVTDSSDSVLEQQTWNGYFVTSDGCLFPKKDVERDIEEGVFKRPLGPAPLGFRWDPIRGLWEPTRMSMDNKSEPLSAESDVEIPGGQSVDVESEIDPHSDTGTAQEAVEVLADGHDTTTTDQVMWKNFQVSDDGCLFPKLTPKRDKDGSSFKRPKGAAPLGFRWDPVRGLWEPTRTATANPTDLIRDSTEIVTDTLVLPSLDMAPDPISHLESTKATTDVSSNVHDSNCAVKWKGYEVTDDGCLFPKQSPKRDKDGSSFKRPKGSAPLGFRWDAVRGLWEPTKALPENRSERVLLSTENVTDTPDLPSLDMERDRNLRTERAIVMTAVSANVHHSAVKWKGYEVTDDGCLFPKQSPKREKDGSSFKRPQGAAPLGFRWDPVRGLWEPTKALPENQSDIVLVSTENLDQNSWKKVSSETSGASGANVNNASGQGTWKDFKVTEDGCLFPKQSPKRDKDGSSFKRPKGAAPLGFCWDPLRGLWVPFTDCEVHITEKPDRTLRERVMDELMGGETWKGFGVTADGSLLPRKEPKREAKDGSLFKRPQGAAPRGFRWNSVLGVWEGDFRSDRSPAAFSIPIVTVNTVVAPDSPHLNPLSNKQPNVSTLHVSPPLDEVNQSLVPSAPPPADEPVREATPVEQRASSYPKRSQQARTLQRYSPPLTK